MCAGRNVGPRGVGQACVVSLVAPLLPTSSSSCSLPSPLAKRVSSADSSPCPADDPSPVDTPDPAPAAPPHPEVAPLFPEVVPAVAGATPISASPATAIPTLPPRLGVEHSLGPFRVRPAELRLEAAMLAVLALYGLSTLAIRRSNSSRASAWFRAHEEVLRAEFAGVGLGGDKLFASDGGDEFSSYASGRRAVEYMWAKVKTGGQDVLARLYDLARGVYDYSYDSGKDKVVRRSSSFVLPARAPRHV